MDDQMNPLLDALLREKDAVISGLRAEVAELKAMERRLWVVVAHLQAATGEANGWAYLGQTPSGDSGGYDDFNNHLSASANILGGIVALTVAK
jgi:hypothetical protein